ncbi:MAG: hypothetical protein V3T84_14665 [Phycisphaerales bacterium]
MAVEEARLEIQHLKKKLSHSAWLAPVTIFAILGLVGSGVGLFLQWRSASYDRREAELDKKMAQVETVELRAQITGLTKEKSQLEADREDLNRSLGELSARADEAGRRLKAAEALEEEAHRSVDQARLRLHDIEAKIVLARDSEPDERRIRLQEASDSVRGALEELPISPRATAAVATWNIRDSADERLALVASGLADMDADVNVLIESPDEEQMRLLMNYLSSDGLCFRYFVLEQTASDKIAVVYRCGTDVEATNLTKVPGSNNGNRFLREAVAAEMRIGQFDFVLIAVHMKAGRSSANREIRSRQASAIADYIEEVTGGAEKDILVVGDYNMVPPSDTSDNDRENFEVMGSDGFLRFISSEDLVGQSSHFRRDAGTGSLIDGYAVSAEYTSEYVSGSLRIFPMNRALGMSLIAYVCEVSDHLPLVARFRITFDDD